MAFKKKLYQLNPNKESKKVILQQTKTKVCTASVTMQSNERYVRETLANKLSGTHMGIWLLIPEYLRLGAWDLLKGVFSSQNNNDLNARIAMQMVNESALCVNRIREKGSLCNQGFSIANGLSFLTSDETVHEILNAQSIGTFEQMQVTLMQLRRLNNHYDSQNVFAIDPHRIGSTTKRTMPCKKKRSNLPAEKMMQTFFCVDAITGQPLAFTIGSSGRSCSSATLRLIKMIEQAGQNKGLFIADKEHFTKDIMAYFYEHPSLDILIPAPNTQKMKKYIDQLQYNRMWAGYALAESDFQFMNSSHNFKLIVQRQGERKENYSYTSFLTTSDQEPVELLTNLFPERWTIEEFFNFEGDMGWNRASTFNLNVRYAKQSLALIAQTATHQLKNRLPNDYRHWTAAHTAGQVLTNMEGDIRVEDDTIIVTYYRDHVDLNLKGNFENMPKRLQSEGVDPRIPWLFDYKLDFRFK